MTLMLHAGAEPITYELLGDLPLPEATESHIPIAHKDVVDMVKYALGFYKHEVVQEDYGVTPDGLRFFGVLSLQSEYGDYTDTVGLRNSNDKRFPIGISFGSRVFVCDNLAFNGDQVIRRKHTLNAKRELPGLVAEVMEPLRDQRMAQARAFEAYRHRQLTEPELNNAIMMLYKTGVINLTKIADLLETYETPPYDWGEPTAWRLFNATTYVLTGKVAENPAATKMLHKVIDGFFSHRDPDQLLLLQ